MTGKSELDSISDWPASGTHPVDQVMQGAVDTHVHAMPFINETTMSLDVFELSRSASEVGMSTVVVKPYFGSSCQIAYLANKYAGGATVVGGVTLNFAAGGFNPDAVRVAAHDGIYDGFRPGRVVWMPERSALHRAKHLGFALDEQDRYLTPFKNGAVGNGLIAEAEAVLEVISEEDLVLATSHLSPEEGLALIEHGRNKGISRFLITHASHSGVGYTLEQKKRAVALGAFIEEAAITWEPAMALFHYRPIDAEREIFETMAEIGPAHFCLSTDAGFWAVPSPAEAYRTFIALLLGRGFSVEQVRQMAVSNPRKLLRLDVVDDRPEVTRDQLGN